MTHLGVNVYYWGDGPQQRFLVDQVLPFVRRLLDEGLADRFWFTRFDARGPHLCLLFTPADDARPSLRRRLEKELATCLAAAPSAECPDPATLDDRHQQCRGKELCAADSLPGLAANNSFVFFDHPADGYPFAFSRGLEDPDELWRRVGEVVLWATDRMAAGDAMAAAVCWTAAVDAALSSLGNATEAYWRHHATTLVMPLAERLAEDEEAVLASIPGIVGERNSQSFGRLWRQVEEGRWTGPEPAPLVAASPLAGRNPWSLLREINHTTLGQLGLPVRLHLPLVFYAWQRNLSLSPAA